MNSQRVTTYLRVLVYDVVNDVSHNFLLLNVNIFILSSNIVYYNTSDVWSPVTRGMDSQWVTTYLRVLIYDVVNDARDNLSHNQLLLKVDIFIAYQVISNMCIIYNTSDVWSPVSTSCTVSSGFWDMVSGEEIFKVDSSDLSRSSSPPSWTNRLWISFRENILDIKTFI